MTAVKAGDRVRATLGENVLVGTVTYTYNVNDNFDVGATSAPVCLYDPAAPLPEAVQ